MGRFDLTDIEGAAIQASRPTKVRGVKRVDDRQVLHGIFWWLGSVRPGPIFRRDTGPHTTCVNRFNRWRRAGHRVRILRAVSEAYNGHATLEGLTGVSANCKGLADCAYDSNAVRELVAAPGGQAVIPSMPQRNPVIPYDRVRYKDQNCVERFFREIATPYDKRDDNFLASVQRASIRIRLRSYE